MKKHLLVIGIIFVLFISTFASLSTGLDSNTSEDDVELDRMLGDLRFICTDLGGFNSVKYK